jgi:hypothetical protein
MIFPSQFDCVQQKKRLTGARCESVQRPEDEDACKVFDKQYAEQDDCGCEETGDEHVVDTQTIGEEG